MATGTEMLKQIRKYKGKIQVVAMRKNDVFYVYAERKDLVEHFTKFGERESGSRFDIVDGDAVIETEL